MANKMTKEEALQILYKELDEDTSLPLAAGATNAVPGEGNPNADIMFIGEAPGKNEDLQGRPFIGAAGKLLDQLIESIGLQRSDIYIANVIKHRPPNNRDPLPAEIEAYKPYLDAQVDIIDPLLFVTLGRFSMEFMLGPGFSISKIHGEPKRKNGRVIMPVYHPAAALYSGNLRPALFADFAKIPKILETIKKEKKK